MKISEFVKKVVIPVVSALFLAALFRPLCMENGECNYLNLWWFMGIPSYSIYCVTGRTMCMVAGFLTM